MTDSSPPADDITPAIPSGTVAILRDRDGGGLEVLMVRRAPDERDTFSGMWVFPGGAVEESDEAAHVGELAVAQVAAVRETLEEAGIALSPTSLQALDRWEPEPRSGPHRRYSAWIFLAPATEGTVTVDGTEIHAHDWLPPAEVLARHAAGEMRIAPPTWVTLLKLSDHASVDAAMTWARGRTSDDYRSRMSQVDEEMIITWYGDELHDGPEGGRHRLWMTPGGWRYERTS